MAYRSKTLRCLVFVAVLLGVAHAQATSIRIDIDTDLLGLDTTNWDLAFDLIDGNPQPNWVTIKSLTITDGALTDATPYYPTSGNVTGTLPAPPGTVTLDDSLPASNFFNEYSHNANLGTWLSFVFEISGKQEQGPDPDTFSFYLLNNLTGAWFETTDPTGAFFVYSIGNDDQPTLFQPLACPQDATCVAAEEVPNGVPEPGALALAIAALLALGLMHSVGTSSGRKKLTA